MKTQWASEIVTVPDTARSLLACHRGLWRRRRSTSIAQEWRAGISRPVVRPRRSHQALLHLRNDPFFSLTSEVGSTSSGNLQSMNSNNITAPQWQFVQARWAPTAGRSIGRTERIGYDATLVDAAAMVTGIAVRIRTCGTPDTAMAIVPMLARSTSVAAT